MKATFKSITNLEAERRAKVTPLYLELRAAVGDDSLPLEFRQRRERELRGQIDGTNSEYAGRIRDAAMACEHGLPALSPRTSSP